MNAVALPMPQAFRPTPREEAELHGLLDLSRMSARRCNVIQRPIRDEYEHTVSGGRRIISAECAYGCTDYSQIEVSIAQEFALSHDKRRRGDDYDNEVNHRAWLDEHLVGNNEEGFYQIDEHELDGLVRYRFFYRWSK